MPNQISILEPVVHISSGEHIVERPIVLDRPTRFECEPGTWFISATGKPLFSCRTDGVSFRGAGFRGGPVLDSRMTNGGFRRWQFIDCEFDGSLLAIGDPAENMAGTGLVADVVIECGLFHSCRTQFTLLFRNAHTCRVLGTEFSDCGISGEAGDAIKCTGGSHDITIRDCSIHDIARDAIDLFWSNRITVDNCRMTRCGGLAIDAKWIAETPSGWHHRVTNNLAEDCAGGMSINTSYAYVAGNTILRCGGDGIRCVSASDDAEAPCECSRFGHNYIEGCGRHGMYVAGRHSIAEANIARANAGQPFVFVNVTESANVAA